MNILFLGGTGFFGKSFIKYLKKQKSHRVESLTIVGRKTSPLSTFYSEVDLSFNLKFLDVDVLQDLKPLYDGNYSHIVHAANDSTNVSSLSDINRFTQIVDGTRNILDLVKNYHENSKFLYISSGGVYDLSSNNITKQLENQILEYDPLDYGNIYKISKRISESLCSLYYSDYKLNISIARCFAFSGEDLPKSVHFAIGNFAKNVILSEDIIIKSDGESIRSYLDQEDLSEWILTILSDDKFDLNCYNIGSERAVTIKELAYIFCEQSKKNINVRILNSKNNLSENSVYLPDTSKIRDVLGVRETITLEDSISKMIKSL